MSLGPDWARSNPHLLRMVAMSSANSTNILVGCTVATVVAGAAFVHFLLQDDEEDAAVSTRRVHRAVRMKGAAAVEALDKGSPKTSMHATSRETPL